MTEDDPNVPFINPTQRAALTKMFELAEGYSGASVRARSLLCAWWNGSELGGFDFADLWSFDADNLKAAMKVINMIAVLPGGTYADAFEGFGPRMERLARRRAFEIAPPHWLCDARTDERLRGASMEEIERGNRAKKELGGKGIFYFDGDPASPVYIQPPDKR